MIFKIRYYITLVIISTTFFNYSQSLDSLIKLFDNSIDKEVKINSAAKLVLDSYLTTGDLKQADYYYEYVLRNYTPKKNIQNNPLSHAKRNKAIIYYYLGKVDSSLKYFEQSLLHSIAYSDKYSECKNLNNIASIYYTKGDYKKALNIYIKGAEKEKEYNFEEGEHISLNNIGYIYNNLKIYEKAKMYFRKGENCGLKNNNLRSLLYSYDGLSNCFPDNRDSSIFYKFKSYEIAVKLNDMLNITLSSNDIANSYLDNKEYDSALKYANKCIELCYITQHRTSRSYAFNVLKSYYTIKEDKTNALRYTDSVKYNLDEKNVQAGLSLLYRSISETYEKFKIYDSSLKYLKKSYFLNESIYKTELSSTIIELQTKYDFSKKDNEIKSLNEINKQKQQTIYISIIGLIGLLASSVYIFYISFKRKKLNYRLKLINIEVENKKKLIEEKQNEILDSIHYAKRIQNSLLEHKEFLNTNLVDYFIFFKPKDIVSGDFYWAAQNKEKLYIAVCDSTGHGVPGAFMSLLNIGFLSEAINEKNISEPAEVFNYVRDRLISSISKEGQKDGFDGILLCINKSANKITYAAANNSPVLVRKNELILLEKDRMPVGKGEKDMSFRNFEINIEEHDMLYLYTDGYADQFGGPKGKKFMYKQLNDLICSVSSKNLMEQHSILEKTFDEWKKNVEQVDDVLIIGVKI